MARPIKKVAIVGADGSLGPSVLSALCEAGFTVTALKRASSKTVSNYPEGVTERRVSDTFEVDEITEALHGQDAIVITMPGGQTDIQKKIADACIKAGVRKMIPADFGSVDSGSERAMELVPLYKHKTELRSYLTQLAEKNDAFTWTSLVCGHFFDYSLDFLHIYPKEHRADVVDKGTELASFSTFVQTGSAVVAILQHVDEDAIKNRVLFMQSFCKTQIDVVRAFEKATESEWKIRHVDGHDWVQENIKKRDEGDKEAIEELVWWLGAVEANWESRSAFANDLLGLKEESLDEAVRQALDKFS